jgi:hypothetical protein
MFRMSNGLPLGALEFVVGLCFLVWAPLLSRRYNTLTTRLRERNPKINPPPTPVARARNTQIMTVLFRVLGCVLAMVGGILVLGAAAGHIQAAPHK